MLTMYTIRFAPLEVARLTVVLIQVRCKTLKVNQHQRKKHFTAGNLCYVFDNGIILFRKEVRLHVMFYCFNLFLVVIRR